MRYLLVLIVLSLGNLLVGQQACLNESESLNTELAQITNYYNNNHITKMSDMNGDGLIDIVVVTSFGKTIQLLVNKGDYYLKGIGLATADLEIDELEIEDIDGDGDQDIAYHNNSGIFIIDNLTVDPDTINFQALSPIITNTLDAEYVDFDFDGDFDILKSSNDSILLYTNNNNSFSVSTLLGLDTTFNIFQIVPFNYDNEDNIIDIGYSTTTAAGQPGRLFALYSDNGIYNNTLVSNNNTFFDLSSIDLDNDGHEDLFGSYSNPFVLYNEGVDISGNHLGFTYQNFSTQSWSPSQAIADLDNDGQLDIMAHEDLLFEKEGNIYLFKQTQPRVFTTSIYGGSYIPFCTSIAAANISSGPNLEMICSTTTGTIYKIPDSPIGIDFDREIITTNLVSPIDVEIRRDVSGNFIGVMTNSLTANAENGNEHRQFQEMKYNATAQRWQTDKVSRYEFNNNWESRAFMLVDINNDGWEDILGGFKGGIKSYIYNPSIEEFDIPTVLVSRSCRILEPFDLDGDSDMDAIGIDWNRKRFRLRNNGNGTFSLAILSQDVCSSNNQKFNVGDVDNDGDLDIINTCSGGRLDLFINNGSLSYTMMNISTSEDSDTKGFVIDYNTDNLPDLMVSSGEEVKVYINNGGGSYTSQIIYTWTEDITAMEFEDLQQFPGSSQILLGGKNGKIEIFNLVNNVFESAVMYDALTTEIYEIKLAEITGDASQEIILRIDSTNPLRILSCSLDSIFVDLNAGGMNNGSSWQDAYVDLNDALDENTNSNIILVAEGEYYPDVMGLTNPREAEFQFSENTILLGGYPTGGGLRDWLTNESTMNGNIGNLQIADDNAYSLFNIASAVTVEIDGFTLKNAYNNLTSDPVINVEGVLKFRNSIVDRHQAQGPIISIGAAGFLILDSTKVGELNTSLSDEYIKQFLGCELLIKRDSSIEP